MKKLRVQNSNSISLEKHTATPIVVEKRYDQSFPLNCGKYVLDFRESTNEETIRIRSWE